MKVLVTGSSGFIGKNLIKALNDYGFITIEVNRAVAGSPFPVDFNNYHAEAWLHLAGKSQDVNKPDLTDEYLQANVELSKKVFNGFLNDPVAQTFIYFSSVKAAASTVEGRLTEDFEQDISSPYGLSKKMAEQALLAAELPHDKKLIILRPAMVYGFDARSNLYSLFKFIKKGLPYPFAAFSNKRTMLSVDNLLFVVLHILRSPDFAGGVYNIADDEPVSVNELIELIGKAINKKPLTLAIPQALIKAVYSAGEKLSLPFNSFSYKKLTENYLVDNSKLKHAMKQPLPVSAKEGLSRLFNEFNQQQA